VVRDHHVGIADFLKRMAASISVWPSSMNVSM